METHRTMHLVTIKDQGHFLSQVISGHVTLRSTGDQRRSMCISIHSIWPAAHNEIICNALSLLFKNIKGKCARNLIWPEMALAEGHWRKLHLDHYHWPEIRSSWRFMMIADETVVVQAQNARWIAILAWHGLEKEVVGHKSLGWGSWNFQKICKIV